jgi:AcrR family transcriptional regulator
MPKVDEAYLEARRTGILDAAMVAFAAKGFVEATVEDIASEAGLSHGAIYRYFSSKDDIIEAVSRLSRGTRASRFEAAAQGADEVEALEGVLRSYVAMHARPENRDEGRLRLEIFSASMRDRGVAEALRDGWEDVAGRFAEIIERGRRAGTISSELDSQAVARVLMALHDGLYLHQTIEPTLDTEALLEVVGALIGGLRVAGEKGA